MDFLTSVFNIALVEYYYRSYGTAPSASGRLKWLRSKRKRILIATIAVVLALSSSPLLEIRAGLTDRGSLGRLMGIHFADGSPFYGLISETYVYCALPFENFSNFYRVNTGGQAPGIGFFRPLLSIIGLGPLADQMFDRIDLNFELLPLNTYPFVALIYLELGVFGVMIVPIIYGLLVSWLYARFRNQPNFVNFFLYINSSFGWLWLFSTAGFTVLTFYLQMAFVVGLSCLSFAYRICSNALGKRTFQERTAKRALSA
jgi:oligosaccharide repeat unit polymerase